MSARDPRIAPATSGDLDAICKIADEGFPAPWSREAFASEVGRPGVCLDVLRPAVGAFPCAFIHYWIVYDEFQLHNLAVLHEHRRKGYALTLMQDLLRAAHDQEAAFVSLEVRRSNANAIRLYQGLGFSPIGVRPKYYSDNHEDAIMMLLEKP